MSSESPSASAVRSALRAAVLEWQHRDPETFLGARGARVGRGRTSEVGRRSCGSLLGGNLQARLAEAVDEVLDEFRGEPLGELVARR